MKANELMIGDWVSIPSELNRRKRIRTTFCMDLSALYRPIPLTEDILIANGFGNKNMGVVFYKENPNNIKFNLISEQVYIKGNGGDCIMHTCLYIHELQHALRLCGLNELADNFKLSTTNFNETTNEK